MHDMWVRYNSLGHKDFDWNEADPEVGEQLGGGEIGQVSPRSCCRGDWD